MGIDGLEFHTVDIKFDKGLETKTQRKLVAAGKWQVLKNVTLSADYTPKKRDGIAALVATANGNGLATYNDELLVVNGSAISSVSTAPTVDTVTAATGQLGYVSVTARDVAFPSLAGGAISNTQDSPDCAYGAGYTCYVWNDVTSGTPGYALLDEVTGDVVKTGQLTTTGAATCPRVVFSFDAFFFLWNDISGAAGQLGCQVIAVSAPTVIGSAVYLVSSASLARKPFDAIDFGRSGIATSIMVAYGWRDGVTSVRTIRVARTGTVPSIVDGPSNIFTNAEIPLATYTNVGIAAFSATVAGVFPLSQAGGTRAGMAGASVDIHGAIIGSTVLLDANVTATVTASHVTATLNGSYLQLFRDYQSELGAGTSALYPIRTMLVDSSMNIITLSSVLVNSASFRINAAEASGPNGPWIFGKAFTLGSSTFLPVCITECYASLGTGLGTNSITSNEQNMLLLLDGTTGVVVAKALVGTFGVVANGTRPNVSTPCSTPTVSSGVYAIAATRRTVLQLFNGSNDTATGVTRVTFTPSTTSAPSKTQLGQSTYFAGGSLSAYTPGFIGEQCFPLFPEGISVVAVGSGGAMTAGVRQVVAIYELYDSAGHRHQSAPSMPVSVTTVANDSLAVIVPTLLISQKVGVVIALYMTQAAGQTFQRAQTALNLTSAVKVSMTIASADAAVAANEILYSQPDQSGTTLANIAPGPVSVVGAIQNRLFYDLPDSPGDFGYSQQYEPGVGLQFNPGLSGSVGVAAGTFAGFSVLDEKVIILCARKLFVLYGSGPDSAGNFSSYGQPQEIPSDVGCSEARSILRMPHGIIFKSAKGWCLLGRDLSVRYIGGAVALYDANGVTAAALLADTHECRFHAVETPTLVYSYLTDEWSTASYAGAASPYGIRDALWWSAGGIYVHVSLADGLNKDTPGIYVDSPGSQGAASIPIQMQTSFLHMGSLEGFQRIRWLYLTATAQTTPLGSLNVAVDYDDAISGAAPGAYNFSFTLASLGIASGMPLDFRHKLRRQKCKSVAFTFTETPVAGGAASQLTGLQALALQVGMKRGTNKLKGTQGVG